MIGESTSRYSAYEQEAIGARLQPYNQIPHRPVPSYQASRSRSSSVASTSSDHSVAREYYMPAMDYSPEFQDLG